MSMRRSGLHMARVRVDRKLLLRLRGSVARELAFCIAASVSITPSAVAQCSPGDAVARLDRTRLIGSVADDSARLGSLIGACWGNSSLIRTSFPLKMTDITGSLAVSMIDPVASTAWNSRIPVGWNDGPMWAGRGLSTDLMVGAQLRYRRLTAAIAPRFTRSRNLPFPVFASGNDERSGFASPWHSGKISADLPLRFGSAPLARVDPGETFVDVRVGDFAVGAASSGQWWGPGIRNALVMSNNAAGIPRVYARTARPITTRFGDIEALWMLGGLIESPYFDADPDNDLRAVSSGVFSFRFAADTGLTVGLARSVYSAVRRFGALPGHFADVLTDWHQASITDTIPSGGDQILSLFGRWVFPDAGLGVHVEWAKAAVPPTLRALMVNPQKGQGYTLGLEWARDVGASTTIHLQTELTMLEQTPEDRFVDVREFYASHTVPQGYTQQGQAVGAFIGPASSSQHIGVLVAHSNWQLSPFAGRIRWEETAYYRTLAGSVGGRAHDVSVYGGIAARHDSRWLAVDGSFTRTLRINYLFQSISPYVRGAEFDVRNTTLTLRVTPHLRP
jgi:hypothetical protein